MEVTKDGNAVALLIYKPHVVFEEIDLRMHNRVRIRPSSIQIQTCERTPRITDDNTIWIYHRHKLYDIV